MAILSKASIVNLNSTITDMKSSATVNASFNALVSKTSLTPAKSFSFGAPNTGLPLRSLTQSQSQGQRVSGHFSATRRSSILKPNVDSTSTNLKTSTSSKTEIRKSLYPSLTAPLYSTGATRLHASLVVKQVSEALTPTPTSTSPSKLVAAATPKENTISRAQSELKATAQNITKNEKSGSAAAAKGRVRVSVSAQTPSKIKPKVRTGPGPGPGSEPGTSNDTRSGRLNSTGNCRIGLKSRACLKRVLSISSQRKAHSNSDGSGGSSIYSAAPCGANNMSTKFLHQRAQTLMIYRTKKNTGKFKDYNKNPEPDLKSGFRGSLDEMVQRFRNSKCGDRDDDDNNSKKRKDMSLPTESERDILKFLIAKQVYNEIKIETVRDLKEANQNRLRGLDAYGLGRSIIAPSLNLFQSAHSLQSGSLREETISGYDDFKERIEDIVVENYYSHNDDQIVCVFVPDLINKNEIGSIECERLEQAIKVVKAYMKPTGYLLWVKCGSPDEWRNPKNPFRTDPELMLKTLPSLKVWGTQKDLVGCKIFKMENLVTLLDD